MIRNFIEHNDFCEHSIETFVYIKVGEFMNILLMESAQYKVCSVWLETLMALFIYKSIQ